MIYSMWYNVLRFLSVGGLERGGTDCKIVIVASSWSSTIFTSMMQVKHTSNMPSCRLVNNDKHLKWLKHFIIQQMPKFIIR